MNINDKYLIFGYVRTGTHKVKELINKNLNKNFRFTQKIFSTQSNIFFYYKSKYYLLDLRKKNNLKLSSIKKLKKKKILSAHNFERKILNDFKNRKLILTIREPLSSIASLILYNTKKSVIAYNPGFKITSPIELAKNKAIIKKYIDQYNIFYSKILRLNLNKFTIIDFKDSVKLISKKLKLRPYRLTKPAFHSSKKNNKLIDLLKKNYNFQKSYKTFFSIKKFIK